VLKAQFDRYDEAEAAYRKAIEIDPRNAATWYNLGNLLRDPFDRYHEAEAAYRKAIEIDPQDAAPWNNLGNLLRDPFDRYDEAEAAYRKAIEIDPTLTSPWNSLGNLLQDYFDRYDEAETAYRKVIELDATNDFPRHNLAFLLRDKLHDFDGAKAVLDDLQQLDAVKDTQALQNALFASYDDNWSAVEDSLRKALAEIGHDLPAITRDDWCRASAVLLHLGFGEKLLEFLRSEGVDQRIPSWFVAVHRHVSPHDEQAEGLSDTADAKTTKIYELIGRLREQLPPRPNGTAGPPGSTDST
jgi:tetratricopeptide (TPR) repeat protein